MTGLSLYRQSHLQNEGTTGAAGYYSGSSTPIDFHVSYLSLTPQYPQGSWQLPGSRLPPSYLRSHPRIDHYIRSNAQTTWHYSCTTPMGPIGDPKAVCRLELGLGIFWVGGQAGQEPEELHLSLGGGDRLGRSRAGACCFGSRWQYP